MARPFLDQLQIMFVQSSDGFVAENRVFHLVCYCFDWNGYEFNRMPFEMEIPYWGPDRRSIIELPFYPLQYYVDSAAGAEGSGMYFAVQMPTLSAFRRAS